MSYAASASVSSVVWYLARNGQQYGPISEDEFGKLVELQHVLPSDFLWRDGFPDWVEAHRIPGLVRRPSPPPPPPPRVRDPAPIHHDVAPAQFYASPAAPAPRATDNKQLAEARTGDVSTSVAMAAYICLLLPIPPLPLIGLVIALVNLGAKPEWLATHYRRQLHTVLLQFVFAVIGLLTLVFGVGAIILLVTAIWGIVRHVQGISALGRREAVGSAARRG